MHGRRPGRGAAPVLALVTSLALLGACEGGSERGAEGEVVGETTVATSAAVTTTSTAAPTTSASASTTTTTLPPLQGLAYETVAADLPFPTFLTARPGSATAYLTTREGGVWVLEDGAAPRRILDLSSRVATGSERGLLGIALHPEDEARLYLHYSAAGDGDTVLAEYRLAGDGSVDPGSERLLLRVDQPAGNHNGGMVQFGPDGFLYLGLGDGGGAGDQFGNAQDTGTLLGGIVRVNPDDGEASLWAYGLRNPWRFWIDGEEQALYVADVGQNAFEEVNAVRFEPAFYNFGWPVTEGLHCYSPPRGCSTEGLTLPVLEVAHGDGGTCSITGGVVYRGAAIPELEGHYLYSDYCGGYLRSLRWDGSSLVEERDWTEQVGRLGSTVSFGLDGSGEVHVMTTDRLLALVPVR